jgi:hypothetical protein
MSGITHAARTLSRCVVALDAGISIDWAPDANGSFDYGQQHHEREGAEFRQRLDLATPAIEVLFDELEMKGHRFLGPGEQAFTSQRQQAMSGGTPRCELEVASTPRFTEEALQELVERVAALIPELEPVEEPEELPEVEEAPRKPWWKFW